MVDTVWLTRPYPLFFIEVGSRRVHLAGCTYNPTGAWVVKQARNLVWKLQDGERCDRLRGVLHEYSRAACRGDGAEV